jgi:tetratricopeptide (TPR) repeat protein
MGNRAVDPIQTKPGLPRRSRKSQCARLVAELRATGETWTQIAERIRINERVGMLTAFRLAHSLSQQAAADHYNSLAAGDDKPVLTDKQISYWETWPQTGREPSLTALKRLAQIYQCNVKDLLEDGDYSYLDDAFNDVTAKQAASNAKLPVTYHSSGEEVADFSRKNEQTVVDQSPSEWDDMERRLFLQLAAGVGIGANTAVDSGAKASQLLNLILGAEPRDIEEWELACADHLHALRTRPPATARQDLIFDLLALRRQLRSVADDSRDLQRVRAALSTLHANLLTRLGEHGAAIRWWRTAKQAADASGDLELRLGVRATEAGHGLFGQRSPEAVLRLTESAQGIADEGPTSGGLAFTLISQAKALSALGRHEEARQALRRCHELSMRTLSATDIMSSYWMSSGNPMEARLKLHFAESLVFAFAGDESATGAAVERVITSLNGDYQVVPAIKLHDALCIVAGGGIERGVRQAAEIIDGLDRSQRTAMTLEDAHVVLRAVPLDAQRAAPVREFRAVLASSAGSAK